MKRKLTEICKSLLNCKATASLKESIAEDMDKPDRSLGELLDDKSRKDGQIRDDSGSCR